MTKFKLKEIELFCLRFYSLLIKSKIIDIDKIKTKKEFENEKNSNIN